MAIPTHAAKAVIANEQGEILFLQRNPAKGAQPNWDLPGGLVEAGEDDRDALRREIGEELGVEATIGEKLGEWSFYRPLDGETVHVSSYEATLGSTAIILSDEHISSQWVEKNLAKQLPVKDLSLFDTLAS